MVGQNMTQEDQGNMSERTVEHKESVTLDESAAWDAPPALGLVKQSSSAIDRSGMLK